MIGRLQAYAAAAGAFVLAVFGIWFAGRQSAKKASELKAAKKRIETQETAKEVQDAINASSDEYVGRRLSKWMRK